MCMDKKVSLPAAEPIADDENHTIYVPAVGVNVIPVAITSVPDVVVILAVASAINDGGLVRDAVVPLICPFKSPSVVLYQI